jgi:hypothetical protein
MKLVDDARDWHRWWSMRWLIVAGALEGIKGGWSSLPAEWVAALPAWVPSYLGLATIVALACAGVGRVIDQKADKCSGS